MLPTCARKPDSTKIPGSNTIPPSSHTSIIPPIVYSEKRSKRLPPSWRAAVSEMSQSLNLRAIITTSVGGFERGLDVEGYVNPLLGDSHCVEMGLTRCTA